MTQTEPQEQTKQEPEQAGEVCPCCQTPNLIPTSGGKMKCKRCGYCESCCM